MKKYITIFLLLVLTFSCKKEDVIDVIDAYGAKNTVTVHFPNGTRIYPIKLQIGVIDEPYPHGSSFVPSSSLPHLHIVDFEDEMWIDIKRNRTPIEVGIINQEHLSFDYSHFRFRYNKKTYYNQLHNPEDYIDIQEFQLGKSIDTTVPNFLTFNELITVKAKFKIKMSNYSNSPQFPEDIPVTGTIHISQE